MSFTCPHCGASLQNPGLFCQYCNSKLPHSTRLDTDELEYLKTYIQGIEKIMLAKKDMFDGRVAAFLFAVFLAWIGSTYLIHLFTGLIATILLAIICGGVYILLFGWYVTDNEKKAFQITFEQQVRGDIEEYLQKNRIDRQDFKIQAMQILEEESPLYSFLTDF